MNLLSEITQNKFLIDPRAIEGLTPVLGNILEGKMPETKRAENFGFKSNLSQDEDKGEAEQIGVVEIFGAMSKYGGMCSYGTKDYAEMINQLAADSAVAGIIIDFDTPGGTVSSVSVLEEAIVNAKKSKPLIVIADMLCSAGYWAACKADYVFAKSELSEIGSIGVLSQIVDVSEQQKKEGVKVHIITPPESSYKVVAYTEALKGNYAPIISEQLSPLAIMFQENVSSNRNINTDVEGVLSGKVFYAKDAIKAGLVDEIGNFNDAVNKIRELNDARALLRAVSN